MENIKYKLIIEQLPSEYGGSYVVTVPSLQGCKADGVTIGEAVENVKEAIESWLASAEEFGDPVPPHDVLNVATNQYSGKVLVRMGKDIHRKIVEAAKENGVSINMQINHYISMGLGDMYAKQINARKMKAAAEQTKKEKEARQSQEKAREKESLLDKGKTEDVQRILNVLPYSRQA